MSVKIADYPLEEQIRNKKFWRNRNAMLSECKTKMLNEVVLYNPKYVGISCYSTESDEVKELIKDIRKISKAKIIVGGIAPTLKPEDFKDIVDEVIQGRTDVNCACYDLVDMFHYTTPNIYAIRGVLLKCGQVLSGFGCPSQCTFCVATTLYKYFKGETKNPLKLYGEILTLRANYGINAFYIIDDLFTLNKNYVQEFCDAVKWSGLSWGCNSRVNTLDEETIKAMSRAHCIQLDLGVERGSDRALQELKKGITIEQIKNTFRLCHKYKIRTFANFLVNIPGETPQDWYDIEKLIKEIKPTITCINVYQYYEGCKLGKEPAPSKELMAWKRKVMIKANWRSGFKWSAIKHSRVESFRDLFLLIKEGVNQLCST
uniref:Putative radical SAM superfamily protein n=1 Tax=viral metagenome TaxID=1070528 RepID=A0A6M3ITZ8_9ZZZZ